MGSRLSKMSWLRVEKGVLILIERDQVGFHRQRE